MKNIIINGINYVEVEEQTEMSIIRSYGAGVFYGHVTSKKAELNGINVTVTNCRRIYYWSGAFTLTQLALDGTANPDKCKFTDAMGEQFIANVIEIIPMTAKALKSLDAVKSNKV